MIATWFRGLFGLDERGCEATLSAIFLFFTNKREAGVLGGPDKPTLLAFSTTAERVC